MAYEILKDSSGKNGIPQYFNPAGTALPLLGGKAPYSQIIDFNGNLLFSEANPANVRLVGVGLLDVTLHEIATVPAIGIPFNVKGYKILTLEIYGTSTSRTIAFKAMGPSGTARTIMGVKLSDLSMATSTTGTGELWQFDITGLEQVIMDLTAIAGGNVTIKGKAVA